MDQLLAFSTQFWILATIAVLLTGISKSGFAGGVGVMAVPLISLEIDPIQAAAIMLPLLIFMDIFSVKAWARHKRNDILKNMLPGALLGITVGYLLFDYMNENILRILLGIISVTFALWGLWQRGRPASKGSAIKGQISGGIAGFTSFMAHAGGPPMNIYLIPLKLPKEQFLGTAVLFLAVVNLVKLGAYGLLGQVNMGNLSLTLALMPVAWLGIKLGFIIQRSISDKQFYRIILVMLLIVGIKLIIDSV